MVHANHKGSDTTYILVKVLNNKSGQNPTVVFNEHGTYFTRYSFHSYSSRKAVSGPLYKVFSNIPVKFRILGMQIWVDGLALPGDTTIVEIDNTNQEGSVKFFGKAAAICDFYQASGMANRKFYPRAYSQNTINNYIGYFNFLEAQYQSRDSFYNAYKKAHILPEWFDSYYRLSLMYEKALSMVENIHTINYNTKTKIYSNPEFMLWFRDIAIDNLKAINNVEYFDFLFQYFLWKSKIIWNRTSGGKVKTEWFARILPYVTNELAEPVREWFLKEIFVNYYAATEVDEVDSALVQAKPYLKNKEYLEEITHFRDKALEFREARFASAAKVGSRAPRFHLTDSLNVTYTPASFYGKWTLIRFFNTYSFSDEKFNTRFLNDSILFNKVQMVNIFTNSDKDAWKKVLVPYPNSGLHLFCKGNWGEMLKYQYGLRFSPYTVLLDPQGIIQYTGAPADDVVFAKIK